MWQVAATRLNDQTVTVEAGVHELAQRVEMVVRFVLSSNEFILGVVGTLV